MTQNVVIFLSGEKCINLKNKTKQKKNNLAYYYPTDNVPIDTGYILMYNSTINSKSSFGLEWIKELDNAILQLKSGKKKKILNYILFNFLIFF